MTLYRHKRATEKTYFITNILWISAYAAMTKRGRKVREWGRCMAKGGRILPLILGCLSIMNSPLLAAPPKQITVGPEDTVYSIAYNNGILTRALISANSLPPPYVLMPGQVLLIPSPGEHIVGTGETLQSIAENYGVKVDVLAQENKIGSPYFVKQGDVLIIPSHDTESLAEALTPTSPEIVTSSLAPLPLVKTAPLPGKAGAVETASESALPADLAEELAREKGVVPSTKPMLMGNLARKNEGAPVGGEVLLEEDSVKEKPKKETKKPEKKPDKKAVEKDSEKTVEKEEKTLAKKEEKEEKEEKKEEVVEEVTFIWPVEGKVVGKFNAGTNDGINIQVPEGTLVKAAAGGEVMYAGNELKGFGNLLLIKHKGGWVTAYAHLSEILVKKGDKVKKGHSIAKSGTTGDAKIPQLHFELRMGKKAVDPVGKFES